MARKSAASLLAAVSLTSESHLFVQGSNRPIIGSAPGASRVLGPFPIVGPNDDDEDANHSDTWRQVWKKIDDDDHEGPSSLVAEYNHNDDDDDCNEVEERVLITRRIWNEIPRGGASKDSAGNNDKHKKQASSKTKDARRRSAGSKKEDTDDTTESQPKSSRQKKKARDESPNKSSRSSRSSSKEPKKQGDNSPPKNESRRKGRAADKGKSDGKDESNDDNSKNDADLPPMVKEILKQDDYYEILGLHKSQFTSSSASDETAHAATIKKAYRRRALLTHPDKTNGDRRAFDKVAEAYDALSDSNKRALYNRFGKAGLQDDHAAGGAGGFHPGGFSTAEDLFRSFFGRSAGNGNHPFARRNRTARYQLEVTLEDMYHGATRNIHVSGGMRQQQQYGYNNHGKTVEVTIPRGALDGQTLVLSGEMDLDPNETPGDLVFDLQQRKHKTFTRKGYDLAFSLNIRLRDAIVGVEQKIRHLNGKDLYFTSARHHASGSEDDAGDAFMIRDGDVQVLKGHGMPKDAQGEEYGDLYVQYKIIMPQPRSASSLNKEEKEQLSQLLDKLEGQHHHHEHHPTGVSSLFHKKGKDDKVLQMKRASFSDFGRASGIPQMPHDEHHHHQEDEHPFGGGQSQFYFSTGNPFFGRHQGMFPDQGGMDGNEQCQQM